MNSLCSHERLELALAGSLNADDEATLHRHLEECELCFAEMERLSGGEQASREIAAMLIPDEFYDTLPLREECATADFVVDHLEPSDDPAVLGRLGGYDVLDIIGRGGMGVVLKGFDRELKRFVAIKALAPHLAHSALARKRFAREAQAAAAVVNLHVIAIHQVQPNGQLPFLVMPLLTGESLAQRLKARGTLEMKEILRIGMQAAEGLAAAHGQGLIHRDVKPANILLEKGVERAVLTDFGLARAADDVSMTRWGIIAGTPEYMSPEQARGEALDGRSDLFSLGCVLYEMATGVSPFRTDSTMATLRRIVDEQPAAMASLVPELPPWFCHIVERLLSKAPAQRFASASEVSQLLEECLSHLQQPTSVPLPASLVPHPAGRRSNFKVPRKGVIAMLGTIGMTLLGMVLMQATQAPDISGQWTSDEWGTVVLEAKGFGQYVGTFRVAEKGQPATGNARSAGGAAGNPSAGGGGIGAAGGGDASPGKLESGTLQLKWSRVERRFNGTWGTGDDRSGKMSLRLVDNEIRGAWTANKIAQKESASPRLADLLWTRSQNAARVAQAPTVLTMPERPKTFLDRLQGTWRTSGEPTFVWKVFGTSINETVFDEMGTLRSDEWLIRDEGNLDDLVSPARIELMAKDPKTGGFSGFTVQKCLLAVDGDSLVCCNSRAGDYPNEIAKRPGLWVREFRRDKETPLELLGDWIVDDWDRGSGDDTVLKSNDIDFPMYALRFHSDRFWLRALNDKYVESPDQRMIGFGDVRQFQWSIPGESKPGEFVLTVQSDNRTQLLYGRYQSMRTRPRAKPDRLRLTISRKPLTGDSPSASDWHFECHRATTEIEREQKLEALPEAQSHAIAPHTLNVQDPRSVVLEFLHRALHKQPQRAAEMCRDKLVDDGLSVSDEVENEFYPFRTVRRLSLKSLCIDLESEPEAALFFTRSETLSDWDRPVCLAIHLTRTEHGWVITRCESVDEQQEQKTLEAFVAEHEADGIGIDLWEDDDLNPNSQWSEFSRRNLSLWQAK